MSGATAIIATGGAAMRVTAAPDSVSSSFPSSTAVVSVTVEGGVAPYTYAWTLVSGGPNPQPINPTSASTRFAGVGFSFYRCDVTDAVGQVGSSNTVDAEVD